MMSIQLSRKALKRQDDNKTRWAGGADNPNTQQGVKEGMKWIEEEYQK